MGGLLLFLGKPIDTRLGVAVMVQPGYVGLELSGGDSRALFQSLARLRSLPPELDIYPGHHYGTVESRCLGDEIRLNKFLNCTDYEKFLRLLPELAG